MLAFIMMALVRGTVAADVPAVVWSSGEMDKNYDMRRLSASDVGAKLDGADLAMLVVVPEVSATGLTKHFTERRLSAKVDVLPFVEAPGNARAFFETAEYVEWSDVKSATAPRILTVAPSLSSVDEADLVERLRSRGDSWALGLTAANAVEPVPQRRILQDMSNSTNSTGYKGVRMTPDILSGVLVGLLFTFCVLLGLSCIGAIQTPIHYAKKGPPSLKEW